tara:strand:- start:7356 stop:7769 length:414 start_codon:yes stop_codon:yes gene_type:complete
MLAVTDEEIQYFKKDITDFTNIEKQIKELKAKMKPYQDKIRELSKLKETKKEEVINFMDCNKLDMCNTDDASYEMKETKSTKTVTKGDAYDRIYKFFSEEEDNIKDMSVEEKSKYLHNYIYVQGRETTMVKTLKAKN